MSAMMRMREGGACGCGEADKYAASRVPPAEVLEAPPAPPKLLHVRGSFDEAVDTTIEMLRGQGGAVWEGLVPESAVAEARQVKRTTGAASQQTRTLPRLSYP